MTPEILVEIAIKISGALVGAVIALVFVPPRSRWGFARRFVAAMLFGPTFGPYVQAKLGFGEGAFAASCLAAIVSWSLLGALKRVADAWQGPKAAQDD
jgi:hypothetical protein